MSQIASVWEGTPPSGYSPSLFVYHHGCLDSRPRRKVSLNGLVGPGRERLYEKDLVGQEVRLRVEGLAGQLGIG